MMRGFWNVLLNLLLCAYLSLLFIGPVAIIWRRPAWLTITLGLVMLVSGLALIPAAIDLSAKRQGGAISFFLIGNLVAGYTWLRVPITEPFGVAVAAYTWIFGWLIVLILGAGIHDGVVTNRGL